MEISYANKDYYWEIPVWSLNESAEPARPLLFVFGILP